VITQHLVDEAWTLQERLYDVAQAEFDALGQSPHFLRLLQVAETAATRYMRRDALYNQAIDQYVAQSWSCMLWHVLIGPALLFFRQAYEQVRYGKTTR
jgi:hypothetical protein